MTKRHVHHYSFSRFHFSVFPHKTFGNFSKSILKIVEFTIEKYSPNKSIILLEFFPQNKIHCSFYTWNIWIVHVFMTTSSQGESSFIMLKDFNLTNIHFLSSFIDFKVSTILHIYLNNLISTNEKWKCLHFEPQFLYISSKHFNVI